MVQLLDILILLAVLSTSFSISLWQRWQRLAIGVALGLLSWLSMGWVVQLSKPQLTSWLQTTEVMQWEAILLTLYTMLTLALNLHPSALRPRHSTLHLRHFTLFILHILLLAPVLFYLLAQTVFAAVGTDFRLTALLFALAVAVLTPLVGEGARWLLPARQSRRDAYLLLSAVLWAVGLMLLQHSPLVYDTIHTDQSILELTMEIISKALFGIANALLIPDIILLVFFFFRSLVLLAATYRQYATRRQDGHGQLYSKYRAMFLGHKPSEAWTDYVVAQFETDAQKDINLSRLMTKLGPVLGLIGTLISMSPALVGLSTGDIAGMAYNMQVVFSATVVGLFISAVGLFTQQLKTRWYAKDVSQLVYEGSEKTERNEKKTDSDI